VKKSRFSEEKIIGILREGEATPVLERRRPAAFATFGSMMLIVVPRR
jgi:hypothetical protein